MVGCDNQLSPDGWLRQPTFSRWLVATTNCLPMVGCDNQLSPDGWLLQPTVSRWLVATTNCLPMVGCDNRLSPDGWLRQPTVSRWLVATTNCLPTSLMSSGGELEDRAVVGPGRRREDAGAEVDLLLERHRDHHAAGRV